MNSREFCRVAQLDETTVAAWMEAGWLLPRQSGPGAAFSEIDLARAQLIQDLKDDLGVNDEGVSVILDLIDQIHGVRRMFRELLSIVETQPKAVRRRMLAEANGESDIES
jgi:chaperone modulatory protein CbpM